MSKKHKNNLLRSKDWLTVPDTAEHLSDIFQEEITQADVLHWALNKQLTLSVNLVNPAFAKRGKILSKEEVEFYPSDFLSHIFKEPRVLLTEKETQHPKDCFDIDGERFLKLEDKIITIRGVWDLCMAGTERLVVAHQFQILTNGPAVTIEGMIGTLVKKKGRVYQLQQNSDDDEFQKGSNAQREKIKEIIVWNDVSEEEAKKRLDQHEKDRKRFVRERWEEDYYFHFFPARNLPKDSVLVVRTEALLDLQERISEPDSTSKKSLDKRSETTYLNIIGALLEVATGTFKDETFSSETQLRDFLSDKFKGFRGVTGRTLADKFAAAKKSLDE